MRAVELIDGDVLEASIVVVACDSRRAIVDWLTSPPPEAAAIVRRWRGRRQPDGCESKLDAIVAEPPRFAGFDDDLVPTAVVSPPIAGLAEAYTAGTGGGIAPHPPMLVNVPSVLDPSMRVGKDHVLSLEVLYTPYALRGGWTASTEPELWLRCLAEISDPDFLDGVKRWRVMTPPDYERDFSMVRGHAPSGDVPGCGVGRR